MPSPSIEELLAMKDVLDEADLKKDPRYVWTGYYFCKIENGKVTRGHFEDGGWINETSN